MKLILTVFTYLQRVGADTEILVSQGEGVDGLYVAVPEVVLGQGWLYLLHQRHVQPRLPI